MAVRSSGVASVLLVVAINVLSGLPVFLVSALFPQIAAGDIGAGAHGAVGVVVAAYWVGATCSSNLAGRIIAGLGVRGTFVLILGVIATSLLGTVLLGGHWALLMVWSALGGMANGISHPATNYLLVLRVPPRILSVSFGIKQSAVPTSTLLAGLSIPVIALTVGWQWAYLGGAVLALGLLVVLVLALRPEAPFARPQAETRKTETRKTGLGYYRLLGMVTAFASAAATIVSAYAVVLAPESEVSPAAAGTVLGIASAVSVAMRVSLGAAVGPLRVKPLAIVVVLLVLGGAGGCIPLAQLPVAYVAGIVLALGFGWAWPGLIHYTVSARAGADTPRATGVVQTGTYLGCTLGPLAAGLAHTVAAGDGVWAVAGASAFIAAVVGVIVLRRDR